MSIPISSVCKSIYLLQNIVNFAIFQTIIASVIKSIFLFLPEKIWIIPSWENQWDLANLSPLMMSWNTPKPSENIFPSHAAYKTLIYVLQIFFTHSCLQKAYHIDEKT